MDEEESITGFIIKEEFEESKPCILDQNERCEDFVELECPPWLKQFVGKDSSSADAEDHLISTIKSYNNSQLPIKEEITTKGKVVTKNLDIENELNTFSIKKDKSKVVNLYKDPAEYIIPEHENIELGANVCNICQIELKTTKGLQRHNKRVHSRRKVKYNCGICNLKLGSSYSLNNHLKVHSEVREFTCNICNMMFKTKSTLNKHSARHLMENQSKNVKEFACHICDKQFVYKNSLQAHVEYKHLGKKKQFSCQFCKMSFIKASLLERHKFKHKVDKKYKCEHCTKSYARKYLLIPHLEKHFNMKLHI